MSSISLMSSPSPLSSDLPNDLTDNPSRVCSSGSCHNIISSNSMYKMCERCREKGRMASRKRTIRKAKERASIEEALDAEAENHDAKKKILKAKSKSLKSPSSGDRHKLALVELSVSSNSKGKRKAATLVDSDDDDEGYAYRTSEPLEKRFKRFMEATKRYDVAADTRVVSLLSNAWRAELTYTMIGQKPALHKPSYTRFCTSADLLASLKLALKTPSTSPSENTLFKGTYSVVASPRVSHTKLARSFLTEFKNTGAMVLEQYVSHPTPFFI